GKKVVKKQPPTKGYAHWDKATFERLISKQPEPLEPRFTVTHGMLIHLLQSGGISRGGGYRKLLDLIFRSHVRDYDKAKLRKQAAVFFRSLRSAGIVELV